MPIYEYRCDRCQQAFEELVQRDTKVACPACHAVAVTKQLSVPARPMAGKSAAAPGCDAGLPASSCCGGGACHQH